MAAGTVPSAALSSANVEAEAALLGALLIESTLVDQVLPLLRPEDFFEPAHGVIFDAIADRAAAGQTIGAVMIGGMVRSAPELGPLGGVAYIARLTSDAQGLIGTRELAELIADCASRRRIAATLAEALEACADTRQPIASIIGHTDAMLSSVVSPEIQQRTYRLGDAFGAANRRVDDIAAGRIPRGLLTGLADFDALTGGMKPGNNVIVAARPGSGKTALALGVSRRAAMAGHGVLLITREMDITELMPRIQADALFEAGGHASFQDILDGKVSSEDRRLLDRLERSAGDWPLTIKDPPHFGPEDINPFIRQQRREFEREGRSLDLVVIDYLGLIDPPPGRMTREQQVSIISKAIKDAARINRLPIITLAQLSRAVEQRDDKRPQLSDLRDSGSIEQDADMVIFLYRPENYLKPEPDGMDPKKREDWLKERDAAKDRLEMFSAKARQGAKARRKSWFFGHRQAVRSSDFYTNGDGFL